MFVNTQVLLQVANGIAYLHSRGVLNCNVKASVLAVLEAALGPHVVLLK